MQKIIKCLDFIIYWSIILLPFSMSISPVPVNIFSGFLIVTFLAKKMLKKEHVFTKTAINAPLMFLFLISLLSIFNSVNYWDSIRGGILRLFQYALVLFISLEELSCSAHLVKVVYSMILGVSLASFDGLWQVFTGRDFIRGFRPVLNIGLVRATASFKDSNTLGIYLSAIAPLVLGVTFFYFKNKKKILMVFFSLLVILGVVLTYSRPTLLAVYVSLFFLGLVKKNKGLITFLVILVLIAPFCLPKSVKNWAREVEYSPLRFMCNDDRIAVYRNSLNMIKHHPLIGVGINNYMKSYKKYKEFPEYRNIVTLDYMYAHNNFLHMAAEVGLIGLGIFIWLLYKLFAECINIYKGLKNNFLKVVSFSLTACLIAFLVNGLTESSLYYSRVALIFWYIVGLSLSLKKFTYADRAK